ncbi:hypothetical protein ABPG72_011207 [Tetrahymena utriculariae]
MQDNQVDIQNEDQQFIQPNPSQQIALPSINRSRQGGMDKIQITDAENLREQTRIQENTDQVKLGQPFFDKYRNGTNVFSLSDNYLSLQQDNFRIRFDHQSHYQKFQNELTKTNEDIQEEQSQTRNEINNNFNQNTKMHEIKNLDPSFNQEEVNLYEQMNEKIHEDDILGNNLEVQENKQAEIGYEETIYSEQEDFDQNQDEDNNENISEMINNAINTNQNNPTNQNYYVNYQQPNQAFQHNITIQQSDNNMQNLQMELKDHHNTEDQHGGDNQYQYFEEEENIQFQNQHFFDQSSKFQENQEFSEESKQQYEQQNINPVNNQYNNAQENSQNNFQDNQYEINQHDCQVASAHCQNQINNHSFNLPDHIKQLKLQIIDTDSLIKENKKQKLQIDILEEQIKNLKAQNESILEQEKKYQSELSNKNNEIFKYKQEISALESQLKQQNLKIKQNKSELKSQNNQIMEELRQKVREQNDEIEKKTKRIIELSKFLENNQKSKQLSLQRDETLDIFQDHFDSQSDQEFKDKLDKQKQNSKQFQESAKGAKEKQIQEIQYEQKQNMASSKLIGVQSAKSQDLDLNSKVNVLKQQKKQVQFEESVQEIQDEQLKLSNNFNPRVDQQNSNYQEQIVKKLKINEEMLLESKQKIESLSYVLEKTHENLNSQGSYITTLITKQDKLVEVQNQQLSHQQVSSKQTQKLFESMHNQQQTIKQIMESQLQAFQQDLLKEQAKILQKMSQQLSDEMQKLISKGEINLKLIPNTQNQILFEEEQDIKNQSQNLDYEYAASPINKSYSNNMQDNEQLSIQQIDIEADQQQIQQQKININNASNFISYEKEFAERCQKEMKNEDQIQEKIENFYQTQDQNFVSQNNNGFLDEFYKNKQPNCQQKEINANEKQQSSKTGTLNDPMIQNQDKYQYHISDKNENLVFQTQNQQTLIQNDDHFQDEFQKNKQTNYFQQEMSVNELQQESKNITLNDLIIQNQDSKQYQQQQIIMEQQNKEITKLENQETKNQISLLNEKSENLDLLISNVIQKQIDNQDLQIKSNQNTNLKEIKQVKQKKERKLKEKQEQKQEIQNLLAKQTNNNLKQKQNQKNIINDIKNAQSKQKNSEQQKNQQFLQKNQLFIRKNQQQDQQKQISQIKQNKLEVEDEQDDDIKIKKKPKKSISTIDEIIKKYNYQVSLQPETQKDFSQSDSIQQKTELNLDNQLFKAQDLNQIQQEQDEDQDYDLDLKQLSQLVATKKNQILQEESNKQQQQQQAFQKGKVQEKNLLKGEPPSTPQPYSKESQLNQLLNPHYKIQNNLNLIQNESLTRRSFNFTDQVQNRQKEILNSNFEVRIRQADQFQVEDEQNLNNHSDEKNNLDSSFNSFKSPREPLSPASSQKSSRSNYQYTTPIIHSNQDQLNKNFMQQIQQKGVKIFLQEELSMQEYSSNYYKIYNSHFEILKSLNQEQQLKLTDILRGLVIKDVLLTLKYSQFKECAVATSVQDDYNIFCQYFLNRDNLPYMEKSYSYLFQKTNIKKKEQMLLALDPFSCIRRQKFLIIFSLILMYYKLCNLEVKILELLEYSVKGGVNYDFIYIFTNIYPQMYLPVVQNEVLENKKKVYQISEKEIMKLIYLKEYYQFNNFDLHYQIQENQANHNQDQQKNKVQSKVFDKSKQKITNQMTQNQNQSKQEIIFKEEQSDTNVQEIKQQQNQQLNNLSEYSCLIQTLRLIIIIIIYQEYVKSQSYQQKIKIHQLLQLIESFLRLNTNKSKVDEVILKQINQNDVTKRLQEELLGYKKNSMFFLKNNQNSFEEDMIMNFMLRYYIIFGDLQLQKWLKSQSNFFIHFNFYDFIGSFNLLTEFIKQTNLNIAEKVYLNVLKGYFTNPKYCFTILKTLQIVNIYKLTKIINNQSLIIEIKHHFQKILEGSSNNTQKPTEFQDLDQLIVQNFFQ